MISLKYMVKNYLESPLQESNTAIKSSTLVVGTGKSVEVQNWFQAFWTPVGPQGSPKYMGVFLKKTTAVLDSVSSLGYFGFA